MYTSVTSCGHTFEGLVAELVVLVMGDASARWSARRLSRNYPSVTGRALRRKCLIIAYFHTHWKIFHAYIILNQPILPL